ncbi:MAG: YggS family pyridoxal phosphate-dependent enzyme [Gammaproteobacteria bacterium]|nr:YggS family pyridoxal phosphate-dependent enzyme [Gammaproteobacteria bacterium]
MGSIKDNLLRVQARINDACATASRNPGSVKLLAVSKAKPSSMVREAIDAGQSDFGENYLQDALLKISVVPDATWHYIGAIQSNKTREIATHFDWVHTVASEKIARRLNAQRGESALPLNIMLQVNVNREPDKNGVNEDDLPALVESTLQFDHLRLRGLMAIPEKSDDVKRQRANFVKLAELLSSIQRQFCLPGFDELSMGMSADLEAAVSAGATWIRIGTAIFGERH